MTQENMNLDQVATKEHANKCHEYLTAVMAILNQFGEEHFINEIKTYKFHRTLTPYQHKLFGG